MISKPGHKRLISIAFIFCSLFNILCLNVYSQNSRKIEVRENGQHLIVQLSQQKVDIRKRRVERKIDDNNELWIDGQRALGTGGSVPRTEFSRIMITWNGKQLDLDKRAYSCIFDMPMNMNAFPGDINSSSVLLSEDGAHLLLAFSHYLGDSEESVQIYLIVDREGHWTRFRYP